MAKRKRMDDEFDVPLSMCASAGRSNKCFFVARETTQNLQHYLWDRESGINRYNRRGSRPPLSYEREFHKSITPNLTIQNVDKPLGFIRKFTPDGQLLLSFGHDQRALEVYTYRGLARAGNLLQRIRCECLTAADHSLESLRVRQQVFDHLFRLRWHIRLGTESAVRWHLNREFSIFLEDGRYVLLAAMSMNVDNFMSMDYYFNYPDFHDDYGLYEYTFFLVDLEHGCVSDSYTVHDFVMLSHNHGVSVYGHTVAILSRCRQCIDLLELVNGKLVTLCTINGRAQLMPRPMSEISSDGMLSCMKQHILSFIYRDVWATEEKGVKRLRLHSFYKNFKMLERMVMFKMQLVDSDTLLIRYENPEQTHCENHNFPGGSEDTNELKLYVFYSISDDEVLNVYHKNSTELLYLLRNFCDHFRNVRSLQTRRCSSSPSNNIYFRAAFNNAVVSIPGGAIEAAYRFNPTLPMSTQSCSTTLYLDYNIFNYDDRLISALERPKISSTEPIRFSERITNITKFRLFLETPSGNANNGAGNAALNNSSPPRELVAFIYHPYEPFFISIQKLATRYVVNFHIYNQGTQVAVQP